MQPKLGQTIGNYEIVSPFGEGGMGELFLGRHRTLAREVIIKTIRTEDFSPRQIEHLRQRLEREAYIQSQLDHPNIVRVYDFIATEEATCMVMEYVPGRDLRRMIARETGAIMPARAIKLFKQILRSIDYAHHFIYSDKNGHKHQGIIHRDLKPANILITPNDIAKVTDFGIVKLRGVKGGTQMGFNPGTPEYMSPEQARGRELDHRSDLYSLGIVFYEMLTGNVPFSDTGEGTSDYEIRRGHIELAPPPLRQFKGDIAPALEQIVLKSLEKDPDARYQTARDFYIVLEEFERTGAADFSRVAAPARNTLNDDGRGTGVAIVDVTTLGFNEHQTSAVSGLTEVSQSVNGRPYSNGAFTALEREGLQDYRRSPLPKADGTDKTKWSLILGLAALTILAAVIGWGAYKRWATTDPIIPGTVIPAGMIRIQGGTFQMGRLDGNEYEKPVQSVTVRPFLIDETEVTNAQYQQFVDTDKHQPPSHWRDGHFADGEDTYPVINVSWDDAAAYAKWASKRLPTEEEWEFAARGTDGRLYPYGNDHKSNYSSSADDSAPQLRPVKSYDAGRSPFGVYGMAGNVLEWTASDFKLYAGSTLDPTKDKNIGRKTTRGGAFNAKAEFQTATDRFFYPPSTKAEFIGFRCAKDLP
jgi:eukaryotic-like serine/threonine-protein kinase